jgi:hypothetical protein
MREISKGWEKALEESHGLSGMITHGELLNLTVRELGSMLVPSQDNWDHRRKVEEVLAHILNGATWFYSQRDDHLAGCAFYLALAVTDGLNERTAKRAKRMIRCIGWLAYHMRIVEGAQEWSPTTRRRLDAIVAASGIDEDPADPDEATSTEAMEAGHA